jgi:kinesin family protein 2/24
MAEKDKKLAKLEMQINAKSNDEITNELKQKNIPTYGTAQEKRDRLKKAYGIGIVAPIEAQDHTPVAPVMPKKSGVVNKIEE